MLVSPVSRIRGLGLVGVLGVAAEYAMYSVDGVQCSDSSSACVEHGFFRADCTAPEDSR